MQTHSDKARRMGVPRTNVLDLRKQLDQEKQAALEAQKDKGEKKISWLQRRRLAKQEARLQRERVEQNRTPIAVQQSELIEQPTAQTAAQSQPAPVELTQEPVPYTPIIQPEVAPITTITSGIVTNEEGEAEVIAAPVPDNAKKQLSALHETIEYDVAAENEVIAEVTEQQHKASEKAQRKQARQRIRLERAEAKQKAKEAARLERDREQAAHQKELEAALLAKQEADVVTQTKKRKKKAKVKRKQSFSFIGAFRNIFKQSVLSLGVFTMMISLLVSPFAALGFYKHVSTVRVAVEDVTKEAAGNLTTGGELMVNQEYSESQSAFNEASVSFADAHDQLLNVSNGLTPLIRVLPEAGDQFSSAENLLLAGEHIAAAGEDVAKAFTILSSLEVANNMNAEGGDASITDTLVVAHSALRPAIPRLEIASIALADVDINHVPEEYREEVALAQEVIPLVTNSVKQLLSLSEVMLILLGHDESKRYLILFQNSAEVRPTGGFIGTFAVADFERGRVRDLVIPSGGVYDMLYNTKYKVISPTPLHLVNPHWKMHDANWWPHAPTSFQMVQKMYRKQGGTSVDGVISLTPKVIEDMLTITGPIDMSEYAGTLPVDAESNVEDKEESDEEEVLEEEEEIVDEVVIEEITTSEDELFITSENFYLYTQDQAERKFDDTRKSKKFIADLTPKLLDKLFNLEATDYVEVLELFYDAMNEKRIIIQANDQYIQAELSSHGWTGEVKQTDGDYIQVVDTNIAGGKTNLFINKTIEHHKTINEDGTIDVTVNVTWNHDGESGDEYGDIKNLNYVRFYVPEGSQLISADGFDSINRKLFLDPDEEYEYSEDLKAISGDILIDEATQTRINNEFGKTVYGNWVETEPGTSRRVSVTYRLPFQLEIDNLLNPADSYSLLVQKQPGDNNPLFISTIKYPESYNVYWSYNLDLNIELTKDTFVGVVLEK